jgi:hypothetical protein
MVKAWSLLEAAYGLYYRFSRKRKRMARKISQANA